MRHPRDMYPEVWHSIKNVVLTDNFRGRQAEELVSGLTPHQGVDCGNPERNDTNDCCNPERNDTIDCGNHRRADSIDCDPQSCV